MQRKLFKVMFSLKSIAALIFLLTLIIQCGKDDDAPVDEQADQDMEEQTNTQIEPKDSQTQTMHTPQEPPDFPKPENLCGEPGFKYLLSIYFYPYCNKCHGKGDIASANVDEAYAGMITFENEVIRNIVTAGQFCTGDCRLAEGDPILAEIDTWLSKKDSCE